MQEIFTFNVGFYVVPLCKCAAFQQLICCEYILGKCVEILYRQTPDINSLAKYRFDLTGSYLGNFKKKLGFYLTW